MTSRFRLSLRYRFISLISLLIILIFAVNTFQVLRRQQADFKTQMREKVDAFTNLSSRPIVEAYEKYFQNGFIKFRELVLDILHLNKDLVGFTLVDVNGRVLFDTASIQVSMAPPESGKVVTDPVSLDRIRGMERFVDEHLSVEGDEGVQVVLPIVEEWGEHRYTLDYRFTYREMAVNMRRMTVQIVQGAAVFMVLGIAAAFLLAYGVTRPLNRLATAVRTAGEGRLDVQTTVKGGGEIEILSRTFDTMIRNLQVLIREKDQSASDLQMLNREMEEKIEVRTRELAEMNGRLLAAVKKAQQADQAKTAFLAHMSHELRTPLNSIIGFSGILLQEIYRPLTEEERRDITTIYGSACHLLGVINDILDISKIESGKFELNMEPVEVRPVIESVLQAFERDLREKSIEIRTDLGENTPPVLGDPTRIRQVVYNLVGNAVKFTQKGYIAVSASVVGAKPDMVAIQVKDTGTGIRPEDIEKIFDEFTQVRSAKPDHPAGTGLGLPITRKLAAAMNGEVYVESLWGIGSTFTVVLPRAS